MSNETNKYDEVLAAAMKSSTGKPEKKSIFKQFHGFVKTRAGRLLLIALLVASGGGGATLVYQQYVASKEPDNSVQASFTPLPSPSSFPSTSRPPASFTPRPTATSRPSTPISQSSPTSPAKPLAQCGVWQLYSDTPLRTITGTLKNGKDTDVSQGGETYSFPGGSVRVLPQAHAIFVGDPVLPPIYNCTTIPEEGTAYVRFSPGPEWQLFAALDSDGPGPKPPAVIYANRK